MLISRKRFELEKEKAVQEALQKEAERESIERQFRYVADDYSRLQKEFCELERKVDTLINQLAPKDNNSSEPVCEPIPLAAVPTTL